MHKLLARENQTESQRAVSNRQPRSSPTAAHRTREPELAASIMSMVAINFIENFGRKKHGPSRFLKAIFLIQNFIRFQKSYPVKIYIVIIFASPYIYLNLS